MSDARLRDAERRWRETRQVEDEARWLHERVRAGQLDPERLELAAGVGHPAARAALGLPEAELEGVVELVRGWSRPALLAGLLAWAEQHAAEQPVCLPLVRELRAAAARPADDVDGALAAGEAAARLAVEQHVEAQDFEQAAAARGIRVCYQHARGEAPPRDAPRHAYDRAFRRGVAAWALSAPGGGSAPAR